MASKYLNGNFKKSTTIIALLIFILIFNFTDYSRDSIQNNQNSDIIDNVNFPKTSNSEYSSISSGTGTDVDITLLQSYKNNTEIFMDSSHSDNLSIVVTTPTNQLFNTTSSNISISQLSTHKNTYKIQIDGSLTESDITNSYMLAASIKIPMTCIFQNLTLI